MSRLLLDKSAYVAGDGKVEEDDELCLCAVTRLELLYSARSAGDYERLEEDLREFRSLRNGQRDLHDRRAAQRELASLGRHRLPIPDLLIAACAQQHGADVLHVDRHYETLAEVLAFRPRRA